MARDGEAHGGFDFGVRIGLVCGGVCRFGEGPGYGALDAGGACQDGEEDGELHDYEGIMNMSEVKEAMMGA